MWRKISRLSGKKMTQTIPNLVDENKIRYCDDQNKAEIFAKNLYKTFNEDTNPKYNADWKREVSSLIKNKKYVDSANNIPPVITKNEIYSAIESLSNKESSDAFGISNKMIINSSYKFKDELLLLLNKMLSANIIPQNWKTSKVTMLPKTKRDKWNPKNYRPISITPCLMRLYEKIINARIQSHLTANKIIINQQSGFRKQRQTKDNLFFLIQKALESTNRKFKAIAIFFDIQQAFDKVWLDGLLYKLAKIKLPSYLINWLLEFLKDRKFYVKVNKAESEMYEISCGVPQGAVLSPTLFSIFINDIPIEHKKYSRYGLLFADDLVKMYMFKGRCTKKTIENQINKDLEVLAQWANKWRLTFATHKSFYMCFKKQNLEDSTEKKRKEKVRILQSATKKITLVWHIKLI